MTSSAQVALPASPRRLGVPPALVALIAPVTGMERQAKLGGVKAALLVAAVASLLAGGAEAWRVDARASTLKKLQNEGALSNMSDRQIDEQTHTAERIYQVTRVGRAAVAAPFDLGLGCLAVLALAWFLKGRLKGSAVAPVAAAALLPGAIADALDAMTAFRHPVLPPESTLLSPRTVSALFELLGHPLVGAWSRLGNAFDVFSLWSALLLGCGVAAAASVPLRRALVGTMVAWLCFRLLTRVAPGG
jgi:hypothetical protein